MKDGLATINTLLQVPATGDWTIANTGSRAPTVVKNYEAKRVSVSSGTDKVLIYYTSGNQPVTPDITDNYRDESSYVSIKVSTALTEAQAQLMADEVIRIMDKNRKSTDASFSRIKPIRGPLPSHAHFGPGNGGIWNFTLDYELIHYHTAKSNS